jgi:fatty-acyl-CoA synthase
MLFFIKNNKWEKIFYSFGGYRALRNVNSYKSNTVPYFLQNRATDYPDRIAYSFPDFQQVYTWSTVWQEVRLIAKGFLQIGIQKGDSIAMLMPGRIELVLSMFAAACVGAVIVPLNTYSKKNELQAYLMDSRPTAMIIGTQGHHLHYPTMLQEIIAECISSGLDPSWLPSAIYVLNERVEDSVPFHSFAELMAGNTNVDDQLFHLACQSTSPRDPLIQLYTSGTLGSPKGVLRTTASFLSSANSKTKQGLGTSLLVKLGDQITRNFSIMNLLPLYHLGGFATIFTSLHAYNLRVVMLSHFNPLNALSNLEKESCKILIGTPFMIQQMLLSPKRCEFDLTSLIGLAFTSAAVNSTIIQKVTKELSLIFFMVSYGSSEAGSVANGICFLNGRKNVMLAVLFRILKHTNLLNGQIQQQDFENHTYSLAGKIDKGVEVNIVSPETEEPLPICKQGEIVIRSHRVMRYTKEHKDKPCFTKDGWYKSGDLGFLDDKGHLTITGRLNRIISRGGEKISPVEIENILLNHSDVEEALVLGVPDDIYGEQICACIVARQGANLNPEQLRNEMAHYLSTFKLPRYFVLFPNFPLSATGKISIADIRLLAMDQIGELSIHA